MCRIVQKLEQVFATVPDVLYGPRVRLTAILIDDAPAVYGTPVARSHCPPSCTACVQACPYGLLSGKQWDIHAKRNDLIEYRLCSQKRSAYILKHGRKHACGLCLVACPFGI